MKNKELSRLFSEIAELLSLGNENTFKIRAYDRASQIIENLPEPIENIAKRNELQTIKGIGSGIAEKINEFIDTGNISYLDELKSKFPPGLLDIMSLEGLGPRKAKHLYDNLNIKNIDDLKIAASEGKIRVLEGFGAKTEENILKSISLKEKSRGRILLAEALLISKQIISELKKNKNIIQIGPAGSLRRYRETIGDIDILCSVKQKSEQNVIDYFAKLPQVTRVLAKGDTKASVISEEGFQVDLRVVKDNQFGAALQYFTGSKQHNVSLRSLAKDKGLTINEYGVFKANKKDMSIAGKTEKDVYESLGLKFIPPPLREDRGEITAAAKNRLPKLITLNDIKGDAHVHSTYSDGADSIEEIARAAVKLGYEWIIISDHSQSLKVARGTPIDLLHKKIEEIKQINKKLKNIRVLCGSEVDIHSDGSLDYPDEVLKKLDFVIASVHTGLKQPEEQITRRIIRALEHPYVNCIGHLTQRLLNRREPYQVNFEEVLIAAQKNQKMLEINAFPDRLDLFDIYCKKAKEMGIKLVIGSDSHATDHLPNMKLGVYVAQRGWLEKKDLFNTLSFKELKTYLEK